MNENSLFMKILFSLFLFFFAGIVSLSAVWSSQDFCQDYGSAQFFLSGRQVYSQVNCGHLLYNAHPPFTILLFTPFALLPLLSATIVWSLLSFICYVLAGLLLLKIVGWFSYRNSLVFLILSGFWPAFSEATLEHNISQVVLLLLVVSWWLQRRRRLFLSGIIIGMVSLLRPEFCILLISFILSKKYKPAFLGILTIIAGLLVSLLLLGKTAYSAYFGTVRVYEYTHWIAHPFNLSLTGAFAKIPLLVSHPPISYGNAVILGEFFSLVLLVSTIFFIWRYNKRNRFDSNNIERSQALLIPVIFLIFPLSWGWNLLLFLIPCALLVIIFRQSPPLPKWWYILLGIGFIALLDPSELFAIDYTHAQSLLGQHFTYIISYVALLQIIGILLFIVAQVITLLNLNSAHS